MYLDSSYTSARLVLITLIAFLFSAVAFQRAAEAKQALEAIFESFDKLDTVIHGADEEARKKLDYAEHAPAIEAALAKLKELTQK